MSYDDRGGNFSELNFIEALYFTIITLITVGYGDINPTTNMGKLCALVVILACLILLPTLSSELLRQLSL